MVLIEGRRGPPPAPEAAQREDGVWTLGHQVINGDVEAPSLVGDAAFVGPGATVERSVIGAGARGLEGARAPGSGVARGVGGRAGAPRGGGVCGGRGGAR